MVRGQWALVVVAAGGVSAYGPFNSKKEGEDWGKDHLKGWYYASDFRSYQNIQKAVITLKGYYVIVPLYTPV